MYFYSFFFITNQNRITKEDALRLVILYALKYEDTKRELKSLKKMLQDKDVADLSLVDFVLEYGTRNQGNIYLYEL